MDELLQELRQSIRALRQRPGWTAHAVLTLALGIGAATSVFTVAQAVLFSRLPVADADRLVAISVIQPDRDQVRGQLSPGRFVDVRDRVRSFDRVAALRLLTANISDGGAGDRGQVAWITASWFDIQGAVPLVGRSIAATDEAEDAPPVALISRAYWMRRFGGTADARGRTISIDGQPHTIIGVMPDALPYPSQIDVWTPMGFRIWNRVSGVMHVVGRLAPGVSVENARTELATLDKQIALENPATDVRWRTAAVPLIEEVTGRARAPLYLLLGSVFVLLLIACVNGANLLLALAIESEHELAVRAALGAGPRRQAAYLLARAFVVAALGGVVGVAVTLAATSAAMPYVAPYLPRGTEIAINWQVLVFAVSMVLLSAIVAGIIPALGARRVDLQRSLVQGRGSTSSPARRRMRDALVVTEIALAFTLVAAAGLMVNSLFRLSRADIGFSSSSTMTARLSLPIPMERYRRENMRRQFWESLEQKLATIPGVTASGLVSSLPFGGTNIPWRFIPDDRAQAAPDQASSEAQYRAVSAGYFDTIGIRRVAGRMFTDRDGREGQQVAIVNETLARWLWPAGSAAESARNALARRLSFSGPKGPFIPIVGVVADVRHFGFDRPAAPEIYVPFEQEAWPEMTIVARGPASPPAIAAALRVAVRDLDSELGLYKVQPFADVIGETTAIRRLVTNLLSVFSSTALLLAAIGVSGLLAFSVAVRRREIGVRMALGASRADIVRLISSYGLKLGGSGVAIGLLVSPFAASLLRSQLFGVQPFDPLTLILSLLALVLVALGASFVPALRASKVDPNVVLRLD